MLLNSIKIFLSFLLVLTKTFISVFEDKIILGIDPGTSVLGYGIIQVKKDGLKMITFGVIHLNKLATHADKLKRILDRLNGIIEEFNPDEIAIEAPFFGKNIQSMLKLGRAQGIAMAAGLSREIPITEYSPKKIKMAITGNGNASKEQVAKMLQNLLAIKELPKNLDSTDGLAAAVCHFYNSKNSFEGTKYSSWSSFVNKNKDKIRGS